MTMLETSVSSQSAYDRLTRALEWPMAVLALAVIPALLIDSEAASPRVHSIATSVNWFVWLAFCVEFVLRAAAAPDRKAFVKGSWIDLVIILVTPPSVSRRHCRRCGPFVLFASCGS